MEHEKQGYLGNVGLKHMQVLSRRGNVLFFILIAVALFAAVSYAVTQSSRGSGDIDREQAELIAARVVQDMSRIRSAVQKMVLLNGCQDNEISFYDTEGPHMGNYAYPTADSSGVIPKCNAYDTEGGGLRSEFVPREVGLLEDQTFSASELNKDLFTRSYLPQRAYIRDIGRDYANATDYAASELIVAIQLSNRDVCVAINNGLDVPNPGGEPPTNASTHGNFAAAACAITEARTCNVAMRSYFMAELDGKEAACFYNGASSSWINAPRYTFYMLLVPG